MINHVEEILNRSKEIHLKKREDYASDPTINPFENFDRSNLIATWFPEDYKSFAVLIGTKLARLGSLLITKKKPSNESIDDSFLDLITYCALFYGYWKERQVKDTPINTCMHPVLDQNQYCFDCSKIVSTLNYNQGNLTGNFYRKN